MRLKGKDCGEFLHRITAGKIKPIGVGQGAGGLLLTGQSRMIAQFDVLRMEEAEFLLATPQSCEKALLEGLERMHFMEDIEFSATSSLSARKAEKRQSREEFFSVDPGPVWPSSVPGWEYFLGDEGFPPDFEFDRIGSLIPSPADWDGTTPALEAGMLRWIDRFKGCYPGQEVVELSLNVGRPARWLVAVEGKGALAAGDKAPLEGGGEGTVTSVARRGDLVRAFVRVPYAKREQAVANFSLIRG